MKTVAIVGMSNAHRNLFDWDNYEIPVWALNEAYAFAGNQRERGYPYLMDSQGRLRIDRLYQLHPEWDFNRLDNHNDKNHPQWLKEEHGFPIYMQEKFDYIPDSIRYPFELVEARFFGNFLRGSGKQGLYSTATIPYMIYHAALEGYERIELYGVDAASETEYNYQKGSIEMALGAVANMGVEIWMPDNCFLMKALLYGYEGVRSLTLEYWMPRKEKVIELREEWAEIFKSRQDFEMLERTSQNHMRTLHALAQLNVYEGSVQFIDKCIVTLRSREEGAGGIQRQWLELQKGQLKVDQNKHEAELNSLGGKYEAALEKARKTRNAGFQSTADKLYAQVIDKMSLCNVALGVEQEIQRAIWTLDMRDAPDILDKLMMPMDPKTGRPIQIEAT